MTAPVPYSPSTKLAIQMGTRSLVNGLTAYWPVKKPSFSTSPLMRAARSCPRNRAACARKAAGSGDEAQASESIEANIEGEDLTTGFNPQFLLDGLTAIDESVVELAFTQPSKPVVLTGSGDDSSQDGADSGFRYLLMPRRLLS